MPNEIKKIEILFERLRRTNATKFPMARQRLEAPAELGVYIILNEKNEVVYVGSTPRAREGIAQRLNDHLNARSLGYLPGNGAKLREKYSFKCIVVKNARERALLEAYATCHLCPKYVGLGRSSRSLNARIS